MQRNFLRLLLLLLFLGFSSYVVLSASAIPATRTNNLNGEDASTLSSITKMEDVEKFGNVEEVGVDMEEGFIERRMDLETQDYEGTGANRDHDPKSPGSG